MTIPDPLEAAIAAWVPEVALAAYRNARDEIQDKGWTETVVKSGSPDAVHYCLAAVQRAVAPLLARAVGALVFRAWQAGRGGTEADYATEVAQRAFRASLEQATP